MGKRPLSFLLARGLNVFYDEENVAPGEKIVAAIENAIEQGRHIVLVMSPGSVASKWVALEMQPTVHDDPDGAQNRQIPIVIEKLIWDKVRGSIKTLNCIDLTDSENREGRLLKVLAALGSDGVKKAELEALLCGLDTSPAISTLRVAGCAHHFKQASSEPHIVAGNRSGTSP